MVTKRKRNGYHPRGNGRELPDLEDSPPNRWPGPLDADFQLHPNSVNRAALQDCASCPREIPTAVPIGQRPSNKRMCIASTFARPYMPQKSASKQKRRNPACGPFYQKRNQSQEDKAGDNRHQIHSYLDSGRWGQIAARCSSGEESTGSCFRGSNTASNTSSSKPVILVQLGGRIRSISPTHALNKSCKRGDGHQQHRHAVRLRPLVQRRASPVKRKERTTRRRNAPQPAEKEGV